MVAVRFAAPTFHCHQVRSRRERHLSFAARFAGNIGPRSNSPGTRFLPHGCNSVPICAEAHNSGSSNSVGSAGGMPSRTKRSNSRATTSLSFRLFRWLVLLRVGPGQMRAALDPRRECDQLPKRTDCVPVLAKQPIKAACFRPGRLTHGGEQVFAHAAKETLKA